MIIAITGGRCTAIGQVVRVPENQIAQFLTLVDKLHVRSVASGHAIGTDQQIERAIFTQRPSIDVLRYPVDHALDGEWPSAGHRRNRRMLKESGARVLVAFPGGTGTANCVSEALSMGLGVWEWREHAGGFERIDPAPGLRCVDEL